MDTTADCKVWAISNSLEIAFIGGGRARVVEPGVAEVGVSSVMAAGAYYHVGISYDGAVLRFYINGIPDNVYAYAKATPWTNTVYNMAVDNKTFLSLNIWNRVLSANDFRQLAANPYEIWAPQSPSRLLYGAAGSSVISMDSWYQPLAQSAPPTIEVVSY
jgi:hypothetical protein